MVRYHPYLAAAYIGNVSPFAWRGIAAARCARFLLCARLHVCSTARICFGRSYSHVAEGRVSSASHVCNITLIMMEGIQR